MSIKIMDVSNNQGAINWGQVKGAKLIDNGPDPDTSIRTVSAVVLKASEGTWYTDVELQANVQGAKLAGLPISFYHFSRFDKGTTGHDEANYFYDKVKGYIEAGDHLFLDCELASGEVYSQALDFLTTLEKLAGFAPEVYTGGWFTPGHLDNPGLARYNLWDSAYQNWKPAPPYPWKSIYVWQYTDHASIAGINGLIDCSIFDGTIEQWKSLGKPAPVINYPSGAKYVVTTAHYLRTDPIVSEPSGSYVGKGTILLASHNSKPGSVDWTTNWRYVQREDASGIRGYAYAPNLEVVK